MLDLDDALARLNYRRQRYQDALMKRKKMMEDFESSDDYVNATEDAQALQGDVIILEEQIRIDALARFLDNGNKKPHEKIAIKIFKTFKVLDADAVREWCDKNLKDAMKPDMKLVEKYATEFGHVDGTETGKEPRVQIATQLE